MVVVVGCGGGGAGRWRVVGADVNRGDENTEHDTRYRRPVCVWVCVCVMCVCVAEVIRSETNMIVYTVGIIAERRKQN